MREFQILPDRSNHKGIGHKQQIVIVKIDHLSHFHGAVAHHNRGNYQQNDLVYVGGQSADGTLENKPVQSADICLVFFIVGSNALGILLVLHAAGLDMQQVGQPFAKEIRNGRKGGIGDPLHGILHLAADPGDQDRHGNTGEHDQCQFIVNPVHLDKGGVDAVND